MAKDKVVEIMSPAMQARNSFSSYVQSIAFNLTLSRRMVDCLQAVRDWGFPHIGNGGTDEDWKLAKAHDSVVERPSRNGGVSRNFVGFMRALHHRGLIVYNESHFETRKKGERTVLLSRAGELTCGLLVECGLMEPAMAPAKKAGKR